MLLGPVGRGVVRGRVVLNVPATGADDPPNPNASSGGCLGDIEDQLWLRIERQEEGLVCKDLDSKWVPGERDKRWIKLKPDYLPTEDLDVVVMGGFYGTGRLRGGKIAEYLVGVVERPPVPGSDPKRVLSFTKVGTGMSAEVMGQLRRKLDPHMRVAGKGHKPPAMYLVTGEAAERPDVWIDHPENSVVFTVKGDIRLVRTKTFRTSYSLRFPRVTAVRWEKAWTECMTEDELERKVEEDGGVAVKAARRGAGRRRRRESKRAPPPNARARRPRRTRGSPHTSPPRIRATWRDQTTPSRDWTCASSSAGAAAAGERRRRRARSSKSSSRSSRREGVDTPKRDTRVSRTSSRPRPRAITCSSSPRFARVAWTC